MKVSDYTLEFFKQAKTQKALNEDDFEWVYSLASRYSGIHGDGYAGVVPELTQILESCNIDVLHKLTRIPDYYYLNRKDVESFVIPSNIVAIGNNSFDYCTNLKSIQIPNSVKEIGNSAFQYCENLTQVDIPGSVEVIEEFAFYNCEKLTSVSLGKSINKIGASVFEFCSNIKEISYNGTTIEWRTKVNKGPRWINRKIKVKCLDGLANIND